jgi:hypothetical protein
VSFGRWKTQLNAAFVGVHAFHSEYGALGVALNTLTAEFLAFTLLSKARKQPLSSTATAMLVSAVLHMWLVLFSSLASFLLRRHLMVWAIFAPKVMLVCLISL